MIIELLSMLLIAASMFFNDALPCVMLCSVGVMAVMSSRQTRSVRQAFGILGIAYMASMMLLGVSPVSLVISFALAGLCGHLIIEEVVEWRKDW